MYCRLKAGIFIVDFKQTKKLLQTQKDIVIADLYRNICSKSQMEIVIADSRQKYLQCMPDTNIYSRPTKEIFIADHIQNIYSRPQTVCITTEVYFLQPSVIAASQFFIDFHWQSCPLNQP